MLPSCFASVSGAQRAQIHLIDWVEMTEQAGREARNSSLGFPSLSATECSLSLFNVAAATQFFFHFFFFFSRHHHQMADTDLAFGSHMSLGERVEGSASAPPPCRHSDGCCLLFLSTRAAAKVRAQGKKERP